MESRRSQYTPRDELVFALPPPPRFDAAASAVARRVEPLPQAKTFAWRDLKSELPQLINRHLKLLALVAIVGLSTGAAGGMFIVERDRQKRFDYLATNQLAGAQAENSESMMPVVDANQAGAEVLAPAEQPVRAQPTHRRPRREPRRELVVNADEDEDQDRDKGDEYKDRDKDEDKDKDDDDRRRNRDRDRKDREDDADSDRSDRTRRGALLYDVMRARRP